ncbi:MAG: uncharacterized membrane protein YgdD (TMEM256/DUF423 family) [Chitinophagales bacterium]|jgi:uncharacterized membrane protein YgdD (TMEM256/DUF423 family)
MAVAVAIGAFAAHGLKPHLDDYGMGIFKTASFYHFVHGLGMFLLLSLGERMSPKFIKISFFSFLIGIFLFSGSLYILALSSAFPSIPRWLGAITPLGGLAFIIGWLAIALNFFSKKVK